MKLLEKKLLGAPLIPHWLGVVVTAWFVIEYAQIAFAAEGVMRDIVIFAVWCLLFLVSVAAVGIARARRDDG